jgi:predicted metal-dependent peptidase
MSGKLVKYYLLCTVRQGGKAHIVDKIPAKQLNIVFTGKEVGLFLRQHDGHLIAREIVTGGSTERQPIVVI